MYAPILDGIRDSNNGGTLCPSRLLSIKCFIAIFYGRACPIKLSIYPYCAITCRHGARLPRLTQIPFTSSRRSWPAAADIRRKPVRLAQHVHRRRRHQQGWRVIQVCIDAGGGFGPTVTWRRQLREMCRCMRYTSHHLK